jgi:hypothetical protein
MIMYFNVDNGRVIPNEKEGEYQLDCGDNPQMFNDAGCPDNLVFENGAVRLKNELEKVTDAIPSVVTNLGMAITQYINSKYNEGEQRSLIMIENKGNANQKSACEAIWTWIQTVQVSDYMVRKQAIKDAKTFNELNAVSMDFSNNDATKPDYSYSDILVMQ